MMIGNFILEIKIQKVEIISYKSYWIGDSYLAIWLQKFDWNFILILWRLKLTKLANGESFIKKIKIIK